MNSFIIDMKTATQAYKARAVLAKRGIRSMVERTHSPRMGCSFALRVYADRERACPLLAPLGVRCDLPR